MNIVLLVSLALLGACLGSFAGATVWRLRAKQLQYDKRHGEPVDGAEYKRLQPLGKEAFHANDRSRCLGCGHTLAWYDLLPVLSWVLTAGRCRYCSAPIGWFELVIESMTAIIFVASYLLWPYPLHTSLEWLQLAIWLSIVVGLMIIFWYDYKWFLVLWVTIWPLLILSVMYTVLVAVNTHRLVDTLLGAAAAVGVLAGVYWLLWLVSKGKWVGLGDAQIGLVLGLIVLDFPTALLALFLANAIGTLVVLPGLLRGSITRKAAVPFGPLLITGAILAIFFGTDIVQWFTVDFSTYLMQILYP